VCVLVSSRGCILFEWLGDNMGGCIESYKIWDDYDVTFNLLSPSKYPELWPLASRSLILANFVGIYWITIFWRKRTAFWI
jgi:hypothetical protein